MLLKYTTRGLGIEIKINLKNFRIKKSNEKL